MIDIHSEAMNDEKTENLLGAFALAISDGILNAAQSPVNLSAPAAAVSLIAHAPGITIDQLSRVLGLSHPGAVRLVDRLEAAAMVSRERSATDGRAVGLRLTEGGTALSRQILGSRQSVLARALASLSSDERRTLVQLMENMLRAMLRDEDHALEVCRLCDPAVCHACPVEAEMIARESEDK